MRRPRALLVPLALAAAAALAAPLSAAAPSAAGPLPATGLPTWVLFAPLLVAAGLVRRRWVAALH